jgi:hypothetical protein
MKHNLPDFNTENHNPKPNTGFVVPQNYFEVSEQNHINKIEAEVELKPFTIINEIKKATPFDVPANYFEENENKVSTHIEQLQYSHLAAIAKTNGIETDELFFEKQAQAIKEKIEREEEHSVFNTHAAIEKKNPFTISETYFNQNVNIVAEKAIEGETKNRIGKTIQLNWQSVAVAASVCGVLIILYTSKPSVNKVMDTDCKTLACLEKKELLNEHTLTELDEENLYDLVDVESLNKAMVDSTQNNAIEKK